MADVASISFSDLIEHSGGNVQWSPDGQYLAAAKGNKLSVRSEATLEIVQLYGCQDNVAHIDWSPDSEYVFTRIAGGKMVQVWSIKDPAWTCKITEGIAGLGNAIWSPDGRHILTVAEFQLHVTVWSLLDGSSHCIHQPKHANAGIVFSADGSMLAVAHRKNCKDYVGIYSCESWKQLHYFPVQSRDLADIQWASEDSAICVQESELQYNLLFYSIDGRLLSTYQAYENALGVKTLAIPPAGSLVAVGSYDEKIRLLNTFTWQPVTDFSHKKPLEIEQVIVYEEKASSDLQDAAGSDPEAPAEAEDPDMEKENSKQRGCNAGSSGGSSSSNSSTRAKAQRLRATRKKVGTKGATKDQQPPPAPPSSQPITFVSSFKPCTIREIRPEPKISAFAWCILSKPNPRLGVGILSWSPDASFLLSRNDNMPSTLWLWDMTKLRLAAMIAHMGVVRSVRWDPSRTRVAICTSAPRVYLWSPSGMTWLDVPTDGFEVIGLRWSSSGESIVLLGKSHLCCCYLGDAGTE